MFWRKKRAPAKVDVCEICGEQTPYYCFRTHSWLCEKHLPRGDHEPHYETRGGAA